MVIRKVREMLPDEAVVFDNNIVENLEWCTAKYNDNYGSRNTKLSKSLKERKDNYGN